MALLVDAYADLRHRFMAVMNKGEWISLSVRVCSRLCVFMRACVYAYGGGGDTEAAPFHSRRLRLLFIVSRLIPPLFVFAVSASSSRHFSIRCLPPSFCR